MVITDNRHKEPLSYEQLFDPAESSPWMEASGEPTARSSQKAARMGRIGRCYGPNAREAHVWFVRRTGREPDS